MKILSRDIFPIGFAYM